MSSENTSQMKFALNYGAVMGVVFIILSILLYVAGMDTATSRWSQWLYYIIMIGIIIFSIKTYRDEYLGGAISFGHALGTGVLIALFASIIYGVYSYIFLKYVDATSIEKMLTIAEEDMYNRGMSDDQIEQGMKMTQFMANPGYLALMVVLMFTFFGFIFSLFIGLFMKKTPPNTFDQDTQEV